MFLGLCCQHFGPAGAGGHRWRQAGLGGVLVVVAVQSQCYLHGAQLRREVEGNDRGEVVLQCFGGQSSAKRGQKQAGGQNTCNKVTASAPANPCYGHCLALETYGEGSHIRVSFRCN